MTIPRTLKLAARKYAEDHGIGYQKALHILFDPIQSAIASNAIPHLWIARSRFDAFEWYRGMTIAETESPVGENFIVTGYSPTLALQQRARLIQAAQVDHIWQLRQVERAGTLPEAAVSWKRVMGLNPSGTTPIILHINTVPNSQSGDAAEVSRWGRALGVYEFRVTTENEEPDFNEGDFTKLDEYRAVEWMDKLMQTNRFARYMDNVQQQKVIIEQP